MNEAAQVHKMLCEDLGVNLTVIDSSDLFLGKLEGITDPEQKRKIIGNTFIEVFEEEAAKLEKKVKDAGGEGGEIEWLLQGTLYPDVIESISFKGPSATIKTHHNVGGLLDDMKLKLIEPLRELFKGESILFSLTLAPYSSLLTSFQTKFVLSDDSFTFPNISLCDTLSPDLDSPSVSSERSLDPKSRSLNTPMPFSSRRSEKLVFTIKSLKLSLLCYLSRLLVFKVIEERTNRCVCPTLLLSESFD